MFNTVWYSPVALAIVAAVCYGFFGPVMKIGITQHGISPNAMLIAYGIGMLVVSFCWWRLGDGVVQFGTGGTALTIMSFVGLAGAVAFIAISRAFALPTGFIVIVMTLVATYPILSSVIEIVWMGARVQTFQALLGCVLTVAGGVIVVTSIIPGK